MISLEQLEAVSRIEARCRIAVAIERFPIAGTFRISRGQKTVAEVVVVTLDDGEHQGRGECVPYARYGETIDGVVAAIDGITPHAERGLSLAALATALPAGAARNAIDCALWELLARRAGTRVHALAALPPPQPTATVFTLSLDTPEATERAARAAAHHSMLKLKIGAEHDLERVAAARRGAPSARLVLDANEGLDLARYSELAPRLGALGVELLEQPLPASSDRGLEDAPRPVPLCADESCHDASTIAPLARRYDCVSLKLDKTGGLTEALRCVVEAQRVGLDVMVGCMVSTSLAIAPAFLLAPFARVVDIDGPLLLAQDREGGVRLSNGLVVPPACWSA